MKKIMLLGMVLLTMVFGTIVYDKLTYTDEEIVKTMLSTDFDNDNFEVEIISYDEETDEIEFQSYLDGKMRWCGTVDKSWAKNVYCE